MKNEEIVKEIKGMQARLDILLKEVEKPVAGWYKTKPNGMITSKEAELFLSYFDGENYIYGFDLLGRWQKYSNPYVLGGNDYLASPEEVKTRMKKLMSEKYPNFDEFSFHSTNYHNLLNKGYGWNEVGDTSPFELFNNGKWAEIIEEPKLTLGGHQVTVSENGNILFFNGGFIYVDTAHKIVESNIDSFLLNGQLEKTCIQVDELKELLTKIDER